MQEKIRTISFDQIEKVASDMLTQGVKPTVRSVISVTGGKTEVVSKYLRDFFDKRDLDVSKMADEIGSGAVAKLIAGEIQLIVAKRTTQLSEINIRQKEQINELVELLEEKVAESQKIQADALLSIEVANRDAQQRIDKANAKADTALEAKRIAQAEATEIKLLSDNNIKSEQEKAKALIEVANSKAQNAELETKHLREQVKELFIDEAKHDMQKAEFENMKTQLTQLQLAYAEQKTEVVKLSAEKSAILKDIERLEGDNKEYKGIDREYIKAQTQLVEYQKTITELSNKVSLSEREIGSLSLAISMKGK